jgi:bifunctional non-homologous end joining protein LigD
VSPERVETEVDGRRLTLSNLEKVLYPATGFTKGEVIRYYAEIAEVMLPHILGRPMTLKRYPSGVDAKFFYEKHAPAHRPEWVRTAAIPHSRSSRSRSDSEDEINYVLVNDRPTLLWAANLATIEFHVPLWHLGEGVSTPKNADHMVFDLDPGPGTTIIECCKVARFITDRVGEEAVFAKTSGSKGLQVYMRLNDTSVEKSNEDAHELAKAIEADHPELVVSNMRKELRSGKVLIDWSQNSPAKTTVAVYSLRARDQPTVSAPVTWAEVDACAKHGDPAKLSFTATDVLQRVHERGDLMAGLLAQPKARQKRSRTSAS